MKPELKPGVMAAITRQQSLLYLTLILGREIFAWQGLHVRDVVECDSMTAMSGMPAFICGGVLWADEAVPVVDLEARMNSRKTPVTKYTRIVVVEMGQGEARQLLGIMMNPLAAANSGLGSPDDIRRALGGVALRPQPGDEPAPARWAAPRMARQVRAPAQPCLVD